MRKKETDNRHLKPYPRDYRRRWKLLCT